MENISKEFVIDLIKEKPSHFSIILRNSHRRFYDLINISYIGKTFSEKLYQWLYGKSNCLECGKNTVFDGINNGYREFCSNACVNKSSIIRERTIKSFRKKYGVDNISQNDEIKKKKENTFLRKYGVKCFLNLSGPKTKAKIGIREKHKKDNYKQINDLRLLKRKRFVDSCLNGTRIDSNLTPLFDYETFTNAQDPNLEFKCKTCDNIFKHHIKYNEPPICRVCNPKRVSKLQIDIYNYIKNIISSDVEIIQNTYDVLRNAYELDIYIPSLSVAIECNGTYWHNSYKKDNNYHLMKTKWCEKLGIKLIHIIEYDWLKKSAKLKTIIKGILLNNYKSLFDEFKIDETKYKIDRGLFNSLFFKNESGFIIKESIEPELLKCGNFNVWNCGYLIVEKT